MYRVEYRIRKFKIKLLKFLNIVFIERMWLSIVFYKCYWDLNYKF